MKTKLYLAISILFTSYTLSAATPTPAPTPDLSGITQEQIEATIAHRNALSQQLLDQTLPQASDDVKAAVSNAQDLQKQIDTLAKTAAQVPILQADLAKAHKACWRDLFGGLGVGAVLGVLGILIGPKLLEAGI